MRRPLRIRPGALLLGIAAAAIVWVPARVTTAPEASAGASPEVREAYHKVTNELLCHCGCARQTLHECTCGVAFQLREEFEARLAAGESADSVIASYIAQHGEQSRNVPPKKGLNLIAWFGPGIAILLAGVGVVLTLLVWTARGRRMRPAETPLSSPEEEDIRRRVEQELREFEL